MMTDGNLRQPGALGRAGLFAVVLAGLMTLLPGAASAAANPTIFRSTEVPHKGLKPFPKWTGALDRYFKEKADRATDLSCQATRFNRCQYRKWKELIDSVRTQEPMAQLKRINGFMNRSRYIVDPINWGVKDYWATPRQFFKKFGDCEDYAIAKYLTLRRLGWDADKMRILVLQDLNLRIAHAVLLVRLDDKYMLLDNQLSIVVDSTRVKHYKPIYSVNENGWWRHRVPRGLFKSRTRRPRSTISDPRSTIGRRRR